MKTLGKTLKEAREQNSLKLRQVEDATGISNAYLSQLENDKIKNPSANILYKLSSLYNLELNNLMAASGAIKKKEDDKASVLNSVAFSADSLSKEEEEALIEYLKFLRFSKNK
ncbi:helix-turn-helix domain-containing protein [Pontibacter sp. 172403-2]|uniref:helix-turn-helix domain-containing protein n=1 Tax=Pontibacter rufus TaxID=2791028 RepID=UPI0018AF931C|nr:helix-turn-helix domain-containing protein [Pontibacter sp. 172403-2]MBF9255745.1 helix-turn-helix domain-containing protein [Pontibacter sp. 172403-2]